MNGFFHHDYSYFLHYLKKNNYFTSAKNPDSIKPKIRFIILSKIMKFSLFCMTAFLFEMTDYAVMKTQKTNQNGCACSYSFLYDLISKN